MIPKVNIGVGEMGFTEFTKASKTLQDSRSCGLENLPDRPQFYQTDTIWEKMTKKRTIISLNDLYVMKYVKTIIHETVKALIRLVLSITVFLQGFFCLSLGAESQPHSQWKKANCVMLIYAISWT